MALVILTICPGALNTQRDNEKTGSENDVSMHGVMKAFGLRLKSLLGISGRNGLGRRHFGIKAFNEPR